MNQSPMRDMRQISTSRSVKAVVALVSLVIILFTTCKLIFTFHDDDPTQARQPTPTLYRYTGKPCSVNKNRQQFKALLRRWHFLARRYAIEYVIAMGSLLGQYRNSDVIPWDEDVDVLVDSAYFKVLRKFAQRRNFSQEYKDREFRLVVHPEFEDKPEEERKRWNCEGKEVPDQEDSCSFTEPLGRLIYGFRHLDIFHFTRVGSKLLDVPDIGKQYNRTDFYPFAKCNFMGIRTWCPKNRRKVLGKRYGSLEENLVCEDGEWVSNTSKGR